MMNNTVDDVVIVNVTGDIQMCYQVNHNMIGAHPGYWMRTFFTSKLN
ncbi:MAG: hypothetical protein IJ471_07065 [Eubacterium sp.]|nr:hypothetical protein [Eubacterium sp.]